MTGFIIQLCKFNNIFFSSKNKYAHMYRVIYIWAIRITRGRLPGRRCSQYTDAERFAGVDGFRLVGIINLGGGFIFSPEVEIGSSSNGRSRRDTSTSKSVM